jgi:hypothetical protein
MKSRKVFGVEDIVAEGTPNNVPWNLLVPDFVATFIRGKPCRQTLPDTVTFEF